MGVNLNWWERINNFRKESPLNERLCNFCFATSDNNKSTLSTKFRQHFMSAFVLILLRQKSSNLKCKYKKALHETFVRKGARKMLVKLTPALLSIKCDEKFIQLNTFMPHGTVH